MGIGHPKMNYLFDQTPPSNNHHLRITAAFQSRNIIKRRPRMNAASSRAVYSNNRLKKHTADYYGNDIQVGG